MKEPNHTSGSRIMIHDLRFRPYVSRTELEGAIGRMAAQITARYGDGGDRLHDEHRDVPVFLVTLSGALMFAAELMKGLKFELEIGFIKCSSYCAGMTSSGGVEFEIPITVDISGRDVIVLEDIVDTGNTYVALHRYLQGFGARKVEIATMLLKPDAYTHSLPLEYVGMEIEDLFVVGYGLDYNQRGRNLDSLYILDR